MNQIYKGFLFAMAVTFMGACSDNQLEEETLKSGNISLTADARATGEERCASMKVLADKLRENPGLAKRMEAIEAHTQRFIQNQKAATGKGKPGTGDGGGTTTTGETTITIPVYVNVLYNTSEQNISDAQIKSQIDVLNADFTAANKDLSLTPDLFKSTTSNLNIKFTLVNVIRKYSTKPRWGTTDAMKSSQKGGIDPTNPETSLNIWVCNIGGGILGYAQFPGGSLSTDGIVVGPQYFGNTGYVAAPFDKGRTATHEIGHWLNLRHIWGDGGCGVDDFVADTPGSDSPNYGCPTFPTVKCNNTNMTMNYMDYTDDACMYMFTQGQKDRSRAIFAEGGPRSSFVVQ